MPIECKLLERQPYAFETCPKCGERFPEFMRGQIQRSKRWLLIGPKRPYCAVICHNCKEIIGWESPAEQQPSPQERIDAALEIIRLHWDQPEETGHRVTLSMVHHLLADEWGEESEGEGRNPQAGEAP